MSDLPLGKILESPRQRDAIHIAVAPVVAAERLAPGAPIGFVGDSTELVSARATCIGIVDPFLTAIVEREQRFWMFLYPQTITSLRHDWTHPAFEQRAPTPSPKDASEAWLRDFCRSNDCPDYDTVIGAIEGRARTVDPVYGGWGYLDEDYLHFSGIDAHGDIPPEFWDHVEVVLGRKQTVRPDSFSCSC